MCESTLDVRITEHAQIQIKGRLHVLLYLFDLSPHKSNKNRIGLPEKDKNDSLLLPFNIQSLQQFIFSGIDYGMLLQYKETMYRELYSFNTNPLIRKNITISLIDERVKNNVLNRFFYTEGLYIITNHMLYPQAVVQLRQIYLKKIGNIIGMRRKTYDNKYRLFNIEATEGTLIKDALKELFEHINKVSRLKISQWNNLSVLSITRARDLYSNIMEYINHNGVVYRRLDEIYNVLDRLVTHINQQLSNRFVNSDWFEKVYTQNEIKYYKKINEELNKMFIDITNKLKELGDKFEVIPEYFKTLGFDKKYLFRDIPLKECNPIFQDDQIIYNEFHKVIDQIRVNRENVKTRIINYILNNRHELSIDNIDEDSIDTNTDDYIKKNFFYDNALSRYYLHKCTHRDLIMSVLLLNSYRVMTSLYTPINELILILIERVILNPYLNKKLILLREIIKKVLDKFNHESKEKNYLYYINLEMIFGYRYDKTDDSEILPLINEWASPNERAFQQKKFFTEWFEISIVSAVSRYEEQTMYEKIVSNVANMLNRQKCIGWWINAFNAQGSAKGQKVGKIQLSKTRFFESSDVTKKDYYNDFNYILSYKDQNNSILVKNEAVKKRTVVNTSLYSYVPLSKISSIFMKLLRGTNNIYSTFTEFQRLTFFERIQHYLNYNQFIKKKYLMIPLDYSSFDRTISGELIIESFHNMISVLPAGVCKQILYDNAKTFEKMLGNTFLTYNKSSLYEGKAIHKGQNDNSDYLQFKYATGMLSGWKITNVIESYINFVMSYGVLRVIGCEDDNICELVTMGDDIVIVLDMENIDKAKIFNIDLDKDSEDIENSKILHKISDQYEKIGFIVHKSKNMISYNFCEFLRNAYYCSLVKGYPVRAMLNMFYKKPTGELEVLDVGILSQNLNKICRRLGITHKFAYFLEYFMRISNNNNMRENHKYAVHPEKYNIVYNLISKRHYTDSEFKEMYNKYKRSDYVAFLFSVAKNSIENVSKYFNLKSDINKLLKLIEDYMIKRLIKNQISVAVIEKMKNNKNVNFIYSLKKMLDNASLLIAKNMNSLIKLNFHEYPVSDYHALELFDIINDVCNYKTLEQKKMLLAAIYIEYKHEFNLSKDMEMQTCLDYMLNNTVMKAVLNSFKIPVGLAQIPNGMASYFRRVLTSLCYYYALNGGKNDLVNKKTYDYLAKLAISLVQEHMFNYAMQSRYSIVPSGFQID